MLESEKLPRVACRYLLCLNVKSYRDTRGVRYFDRLWLKDLIQHTRYLENLTVACPCQAGEPPPDTIAWDPSPASIRFIDLPATSRTSRALLQLPRTALRIWRATGRSDVVHLGVAGWPIPFGWVAWPIAAVRRKPYLVVVESAPWRLRPGLAATWRERVRERVSEAMGRWCVNHAALVILTQEGYRGTLLTRDPHRGHIIHASWLEDEDIISPAQAVESWQAKPLVPGSALKLLFAGRLERSKGVMLLLEAMRFACREKIAVELDILGAGDLGPECERASGTWGAGRIRMLGTIPYGAAFFHLLRRYHAVVVPSLSDEQPRIVYDAYSQAVPVLAADTPGLRDCVHHGKTGLIPDRHEPEAWARLFQWCLEHPEELEKMGCEGLAIARGATHAEMHRKRWRLILEMLRGADAAVRC